MLADVVLRERCAVKFTLSVALVLVGFSINKFI